MSLRFPKPGKGFLAGAALCLAASLVAVSAAQFPWNRNLQLSALTGDYRRHGGWQRDARRCPAVAAPRFALQPANPAPSRHDSLRFAPDGGDLVNLGPRAVVLDLTVIGSVLVIGYWIGTRVLRLDQDTALLVSAGSGICGAAAVLATDRVIESESHKVSVAVATVVVFGTVAMFLYPLLYPHSGFTDRQFGIYTGATVHEVAQALAAGRAVSQGASDTAVITKMLRVLLLAPVLLIISRLRRTPTDGSTRRISHPWFVFWFGAVIVVQSFVKLPAPVRSHLIDLDTVLLASAMFALGVATRWHHMKAAGTRPLLLAFIIFAGLVSGGWMVTKLLVEI